MSLSNKEIYDHLLEKSLKVEEWGAKGLRGGYKKTLECVLGEHIFYVKADVKRDHKYSFVFDPKTSDKLLKLLDNIKGCEIEKEEIKDPIRWKFDHSTAFQAYDKVQKGGEKPINYGYRARFEFVEALDSFLQVFSGDYSKYSVFQFSKSELDRIEVLEKSLDLSETECETLIKSRIGQSSFRDYLKKHWGGCAVTGCTLIESLIASHIKPWHQCKNEPENRLNKFNGLLLTPNLDKLFDIGLISFQNNGKIIIKETVPTDDYVFLGINIDMRLRNQLQEEHYPFLQHHRKLHGFDV